MKIRNGFVSNSSSSSFIISVPKSSEPCPTCGRREDNILRYFQGTDSYVEAEGKEAIIKYLEGWGFKEEAMNKIIKAIDECKEDVAVVSCDNCDEVGRTLAEAHLIYYIG
jgi:hypothetical protein